MSIEAIEAIEKFLKREDDGISVAEIKRRIAEYVAIREEKYFLNSRSYTRTSYSESRSSFVIREGRVIEREKL